MGSDFMKFPGNERYLLDNVLEVVTPHKISVLIMLQEYRNMRVHGLGQDEETSYTPEGKRNFCRILLNLIQCPDMSYKELFELLFSSEGFNRMHLKLFIMYMESIYNRGLEILFDLHKIMYYLVSESDDCKDKFPNEGRCRISPYSVVGLYLRKIVITLDRMTFSEVMGLYENFQVYYEKGVRALLMNGNDYIAVLGNRSIIENEPTSDSIEILSRKIDRSGMAQCKWSLRQAELFVNQQCAMIESNESKALKPKDLQCKLNEIMRDNPNYSLAFFLNYINALRCSDFLLAQDALHLAFDKTTRQIENPVQTALQYNSLHLAILHSHFNHKNEALASLRECIMLAQERGDEVCLYIAKLWLWYLDRNNVQLNHKFISKQDEVNMMHCTSLSLQYTTKIAALCGFSPSKIFEMLIKSEIYNIKYVLIDLTINMLNEKGGLWTLYGKYELGNLYNQLLLHSVKTHIRSDTSIENSEGICNAFCRISMNLAQYGEYSLCTTILRHLKELFSKPRLSKQWMICECYISCMQAIYLHQWKEAKSYCSQLFILDEIQSRLMKASTHIAERNLFMANTEVEHLLQLDDIEPLYKVRAYILMVNIQLGSNRLEDAITSLNTAYDISKEKHLDYEIAILDIHYAYVLMEKGMITLALKSIRSGLECILANGGWYDQSKANFLFVKLLLKEQHTEHDKLEVFKKCSPILENIVKGFTKMEAYSKVLDVYVFVAHFFNGLQRNSERNYYSYKFRQCYEEHPVQEKYLNVFF